MRSAHKAMKTFVVEFWSIIFSWLAWISPFQWIRKIFKQTRKSYLFVDIWVFSHFVLSFLFIVLYCPGELTTMKLLIIIYVGLRIFEILVYQINVMFFDEYRARKAGNEYAVRGFRRLIILLLHNYMEIIFWYALAYLTFSTAFSNSEETLNSATKAIGLSFNTMTTFGLQATEPIKSIGSILIFSQAAIGLFMVLVILSKFVGAIPSPASMDEFETTDKKDSVPKKK